MSQTMSKTFSLRLSALLISVSSTSLLNTDRFSSCDSDEEECGMVKKRSSMTTSELNNQQKRVYSLQGLHMKHCLCLNRVFISGPITRLGGWSAMTGQASVSCLPCNGHLHQNRIE